MINQPQMTGQKSGILMGRAFLAGVFEIAGHVQIGVHDFTQQVLVSEVLRLAHVAGAL